MGSETGTGGLVNLEFLAEFLQIRNQIRIPNTALVLKRAGISAELIEDYHFLRGVESMFRLWSVHATTQIEEKDLSALELMLDLESFPENYGRVTGRVREAFEGYGAGWGSDESQVISDKSECRK